MCPSFQLLESPTARSLRWNGHLHAHICWTLLFLVLNILFSAVAPPPNTFLHPRTSSHAVLQSSLLPCLAIKLPAFSKLRAYFCFSTFLVKTLSLYSRPPLQIAFLIPLLGYFQGILKQYLTIYLPCFSKCLCGWRAIWACVAASSCEILEAGHSWTFHCLFTVHRWWWVSLAHSLCVVSSHLSDVIPNASPLLRAVYFLTTVLLSTHPVCFPHKTSLCPVSHGPCKFCVLPLLSAKCHPKYFQVQVKLMLHIFLKHHFLFSLQWMYQFLFSFNDHLISFRLLLYKNCLVYSSVLEPSPGVNSDRDSINISRKGRERWGC